MGSSPIQGTINYVNTIIMEFTLTKTSDWQFEEKVAINNLTELKDLQDKYGHPLIISFNTMSIEIYDDYRE